jgi:hypothetical protein
MRLVRGHLTYANVMSTLAVFLVIGGGAAYAANTVFSSDIVDGEVMAADIARGAVGTSELADNDVRTADVRDASLDRGGLAGADIRDNSLLGGHIVNGSLGTNDYGDGSVDGLDIGNETIQNADVKDGTLLGGDIANGSLGTNDYGDGSVDGLDIGNNTVTSADISPAFEHAYTAHGGNPLSVSVPAGAYAVLGQATVSNLDADPQTATCSLQGQTMISDDRLDPFTSDVVPINATATLAGPGQITIACGGFSIVSQDTRLTVIRVNGIN